MTSEMKLRIIMKKCRFKDSATYKIDLTTLATHRDTPLARKLNSENLNFACSAIIVKNSDDFDAYAPGMIMVWRRNFDKKGLRVRQCSLIYQKSEI